MNHKTKPNQTKPKGEKAEFGFKWYNRERTLFDPKG